ncbi:MAG: hypothetical protein AMS23_00215 [Bacteroides sp. SM1_62]|nr:MAG: hypothetical protein AMS26_09670 [Bacteroides sp. SM23_62]KPL26769.1 MAG: hypothetical protein AMS23_00215 [Bacteroides sp. SM1_62]
MSLNQDRRNLVRFKIPGAKVRYKQHKGFREAEEASGVMAVVDITRISIRFEAKDFLYPGSLIDLELIIPGKKKSIKVKGNIVWSSEATSDQPGYAVVQFLPFGSDERYNTMEAHEQLRKLSEEYMETLTS